MALGIRGFNPIWSEVDLQGKLFDDTFYLFVLENTIPYIPVSVYHDPDLNVPWTNPIRFLANGTLPVDIYFPPDMVFRLEFRQGPTQNDPLIYEVNNYVPGEGGVTPVDTLAFASSNQITNPQFALFSLQSPSTFTGTDPAPIEIAPGWTLLLAGTGTLTVNQVPLNNSNINPSNAPYALRLTMSGWTADSVKLRQRFKQNGMLWADKIVSTTLTANVTGVPQSVSATLVDSNSSVVATVLPLTPINEAWNEYKGHAQLPDTTNPDVPPAAYIDYLLHLPSNIDIYLTSFQLVVQDLPIEPSFEQDSINRQIDHTYNAAYPIVPIGTIIDFAGFVVPEHYIECLGGEANRQRFYNLFSVLTFVENVVLTTGVNTFTVVDATDYHIGMNIEGFGILAPFCTIINIVGTTITMSANATATGLHDVRFFAWGSGNGSTTFNMPNLTGRVAAGTHGDLFGALVTENAVGVIGGEKTHTLTIGEIPSHTHPPAAGASNFRVLAAGTVDSAAGGANRYDGATGATGGGGAHNNVQPTVLVKKCIRFE